MTESSVEVLAEAWVTSLVTPALGSREQDTSDDIEFAVHGLVVSGAGEDVEKFIDKVLERVGGSITLDEAARLLVEDVITRRSDLWPLVEARARHDAQWRAAVRTAIQYTPQSLQIPRSLAAAVGLDDTGGYGQHLGVTFLSEWWSIEHSERLELLEELAHQIRGVGLGAEEQDFVNALLVSGRETDWIAAVLLLGEARRTPEWARSTIVELALTHSDRLMFAHAAVEYLARRARDLDDVELEAAERVAAELEGTGEAVGPFDEAGVSRELLRAERVRRSVEQT